MREEKFRVKSREKQKKEEKSREKQRKVEKKQKKSRENSLLLTRENWRS